MEKDKIQALVESAKYPALNTGDSAMMRLMLENTEKEYARLVAEGTLSGDIAQFTPILMPMVRRLYPTLIANEILGLQPMTMPTGFIYALVNQYLGDSVNKLTASARNVIFSYVFTKNSATNTDLAVTDTITGNSSGAVGVVKHIHGTKALVQMTSGDFTVSDTAAAVTTVASDTEGATVAISSIYTNEAAFGQIVSDWTGSMTTAVAEALSTGMKEVGFSIVKKTIEAKSRALKGQYTVEMYQDLKAQHGLLADEEIMSLMSYEMQAEMDREVVAFVNATAASLANSTFTADATDGTGRWEIEKFRREAVRIAMEAATIGINTKRGQGNVLLVSPKVATMLEQVGTFTVAPISGTPIKAQTSGGVAGTFDGRYKVIVDQYATSDYVTVLYKGSDRRDAMGFFAPYVPMSFTKVTNVDSGQPAVIAKTRYALATIPGFSSATSTDRAQQYARTFGITFTNTVFA
jgi:hypothetical protein